MVRSVSQLISGSLEMLLDVLRNNEKIKGERPLIEEAYGYLRAFGLMTRGMDGKKAARAMGFESLRLEGGCPQVSAASEFNSLHNTPGWTGEKGPLLDEQVQEAVRIYNELERKEREVQAQESLERVKRNLKFDENGVVILPKGKVSGVVYQEDMDAFQEREESRRDLEELRKKKDRLRRRREKLVVKIGRKEAGNGGAGERKSNGTGDEESRVDASEDSC